MDHPEPTPPPTDQPEPDQQWARTCPECGTELQQAVLDLDKTNADRPEMRPGEMVVVDFCPNADCPTHEVPAD
jgi:hypothetical protein